MKKYLVLLMAFAGPAFAGESYGCEYLKTGLGDVYPGLSRPQVVVDGDRAEVTIYLESGRGVSARREFVLNAVGNWYADKNGNTLLWRDGQIVLHLLKLTANCTP